MSLQDSHQISDVKVMLVKGIDGNGIESIEKTSSEGLVDVYTITYTNGERSTFTVTNGAGGGMSALIIISSEEGSDVSVTAPSGRSLNVEQVSGSSTLWQCETTEYGTHLIDSVLGGDDAQVSLNVDVCKIYTIDDSHMHADIIATYPEGATCSCGKSGETPVYATTNPYTFTVHSTGTYDITIVSDGQTFSDSVTVTESGQEFVVPNGSTVTPTDDVGILLACAGVIDENITTLSDLFVDSTTLSAVIASNNAVDYIKRSKTFAGVGLVPIMTSNTTPSGICSGSSNASGSDFYLAFDGDNDTGWQASAGQTNQYISYEFPSNVKVDKVKIRVRRFNNSASPAITLKIQHGDSNTDIDTITIPSGSTTTILDLEKEFTSVNDNKFRIFSSDALYSSGNWYIEFKEIQFLAHETDFPSNQTAMSYIGLNNYASNTLLADSDWLDAICNSTYFESVLNVKVPTMTSDTTPSGECFGSPSVDYPYWKAFDGNLNSGWENYQSGDTTNKYVGYDFGKLITVYKTVLYPHRPTAVDADANPKNCKIQRYDNGSWSDITNQFVFNYNEYSKTVISDYISSDSKFRLLCLDNWGNSNYVHIGEVQFYGREDV